MKKMLFVGFTSVAYLGVLGLFMFGISHSVSATARVDQGDKCFRCYRTIVKTRLAGEIIDHNGLAYKFRQPACMAQYMADYGVTPSSVRSILVSDYTSGLMIPVDHAWFVETVIDSDINERDFLAFSDPIVAAGYAKRLGGTVVEWDAVKAEGARRARSVRAD